MKIAGVDDINQVTIGDVATEAASWHYDISRARRVIDALLEAMPAALALARNATPAAPEAFVERVERRGKALREGRTVGA